MFDNEIMKPGERLKKYRINLLGATQSEIAENVCSKNMISLIENGKQKLNYNIAHLIARNLNKTAEKKGICISLITEEELIRDEDEQANYIFSNTLLNELKGIENNLFEKKFKEAEELIQKYNIIDNYKIELYKLAADFYYYRHCYIKSDEMCDIGLKICVNSHNDVEEVYMYIYKSRNNIFIENYVKALQQLEYAEKLNAPIGNNDLYVLIFYNKALIYKKLHEYESSLEYFKILNKYDINDSKMLLKIKMVYANCLNDKHDFDEAEKAYKEMLDLAMNYSDKDFIAQTYRNLAELYFNKKEYKSASVYINESLIYNKNNEDIGETLYFAAQIYKNLNEDIEGYLLRALEICENKDRENIDLIKDIIYELILIYMKREDEKNITLMIKKIRDLNADYSLIYAEAAKYYRYRNYEKSEYFHDELINKLKQS